MTLKTGIESDWLRSVRTDLSVCDCIRCSVEDGAWVQRIFNLMNQFNAVLAPRTVYTTASCLICTYSVTKQNYFNLPVNQFIWVFRSWKIFNGSKHLWNTVLLLFNNNFILILFHFFHKPLSYCIQYIFIYRTRFRFESNHKKTNSWTVEFTTRKLRSVLFTCPMSRNTFYKYRLPFVILLSHFAATKVSEWQHGLL